MVLIIRGSLGFSLLPTPSFLFLHSLLQYARWMRMRQSLSPLVLRSRHRHVQPALPSQPGIRSARAGIVSQVRMGSKTQGTKQQNAPSFWSPRLQVTPNLQPQSLALLLAPQCALVQKGVSVSDL